MLRSVDRVMSLLLNLLGLMLILMVAVTICNVISRYILNRALLWADEATVFAMIALAFLGAVVCGWRNAEIRMDILLHLLPRHLQRPLMILQQAVIAVLCCAVAIWSVQYTLRVWQIGMNSEASGLPTWIIHAVIPLSFFLISLIAALRCICLVTGREIDFAQATTVKETVE